jgi:D-serine deaminase-like pyridoxal phosphate-dependent protein
MTVFDTIKKPTLLLNANQTRKNIHWMVQKANAEDIRLRPHFKTHQSAAIGEWFREAGVTAITVSSVDMAAYFAEHGWKDITIAFPANWREIDEINALAQRIKLNLLVESVETARFLDEHLDATLDVWLKIDVGNQRTGLSKEDPKTIAQVASAIEQSPKMNLKGLLTHAGQTYRAGSVEAIQQIHLETLTQFKYIKNYLAVLGIARLEMSLGDTPTAKLVPEFGPMVDELRPGNFVFFDAHQLEIGSCCSDEISVALACPVVAKHPERSEVVIYGGAIHLSKDTIQPDGQTAYGLVALPEGNGWGAPLSGAFVRGLSQEHGIVHLAPEDFERIQVGDILCILPAHSCLTLDCMGELLTLDGERITTMRTRT